MLHVLGTIVGYVIGIGIWVLVIGIMVANHTPSSGSSGSYNEDGKGGPGAAGEGSWG